MTNNGVNQDFLSEWKIRKLHEQTGITTTNPEAVWIHEGQAVLIMEKIDTNLVNQMLGAISKFDGFLGQHKLSSIQGVLQQAEGTLNDVLTGKASDAKASATLANVTGLYNALSYFFQQDLPAILKSPLLRQARAAWEQSPTKDKVPLAQLPVDHAKVKQMFANALNQRSNSGALGYIARRFGIGQQLAKGINPGQVAENLIAMTFTELDGLASSAPKPAPATAPQQLIKQAEAEAKKEQQQGKGTQAQQQGQGQGQQQGAPQQGGDEVTAILSKSSNLAIANNAKAIVGALAAAGYKIVKG